MLRKLGGVAAALVLALLFARGCLSRPAAFELAQSVDGPALDEADTVLVFLHGYGDSIGRSSGFVDRLRARGLPPTTAIVRVEAPLIVPLAGRAWWKSGDDRATSGGRLARALTQIREASPRAHGRLFVAGFSQGATMALDQASRADGVFVLSGCALQAFPQLPPLVYIAHGERDHVCPFAPAAQLAATLQSQGTPVRFDAFDGDHVVTDETLSAIVEALNP